MKRNEIYTHEDQIYRILIVKEDNCLVIDCKNNSMPVWKPVATFWDASIMTDEDLYMNEHPEIFEGEDLKEIEKGRNSDWSKEFFVRKKAEALESLNEQYMATTNAVEVKETILEELNKQTEETIQTMVETEAQKEFMRYAFLKEPKTPIGKLVAGAWRKFKEWWDMHKRKEVEEKTRESVLGRLAELKKETKEHPMIPVVPKKHRETELE